MFVVTKQIGVTLCSEISLPGRLSPFTVGHHLLTMQVFSSDSSDGRLHRYGSAGLHVQSGTLPFKCCMVWFAK